MIIIRKLIRFQHNTFIRRGKIANPYQSLCSGCIFNKDSICEQHDMIVDCGDGFYIYEYEKNI